MLSETAHLGAFQLQLEFVRNEGDKLRIRRLTLRVADRVAEKSLQRIQIASVPGHFDGMSDSTLHTAGRCLEGLRHLGVEHLGDGIDHIHVIDGDYDGLPQVLVALNVGGNTDDVRYAVYGVNVLKFIKLLPL